MTKIGALFYNELLKMSKRVSILVILLVMVSSVIGLNAVMKIEEQTVQTSFYLGEDYYLSEKEFFQERLSDVNTRISQAKENNDQELLSLYREKIDYMVQLYSVELSIQNTEPNRNDFRQDVISAILPYIEQVYTCQVLEEAFPGTQDFTACQKAQETVSKLEKILKDKDYAEYVNFSKELILSEEALTQEDKNILLEKWDILIKLDPDGGIGENGDPNRTQYARTLASRVEGLGKSIVYNMDYASGNNSRSITPQQRAFYETCLTSLRYCIDNGIKLTDESNISTAAYQLTSTITAVFITLLIMIVAGGLISTEISTGSIKSLIIAPVRRWKIYIAKLLALLTLGILLTLIKYICLIGTQRLFWNTCTLPYIYVSGSGAHQLNSYIYQLLYCFAELIPILMFAFLAFMLSAVTRNTALSVGLSMGTYFSGNIIVSFINNYVQNDWIKWIPFNNTDLAQKLFPFSADVLLYSSSRTMTITETLFGKSPVLLDTITPGFSFLYIAILSLCMLYTAFDSFTRRDL